jgi:AcrR family transcriptional regulator
MTDKLFVASEIHPSRSDAVKNRALLLETARRLFAEKGVETITMSAIAEAAGVGKGTLYRHFENKTALCQALLDEEQRQLQARTFGRLAQGGDPLDILCWFLEEVVAFVSRNEELLYVDVGLGGLPVLAHPAHLWWRQTILGLLTRAHLSSDVSYLADVIYVMLDARTIAFQRHNLGYSLERIIEGLHHVVSRLLR